MTEEKTRTFDKCSLAKDVLHTILICYAIAVVIWWSGGGEFWLSLQISLVFGAGCIFSIRLGSFFFYDALSATAITLLGYAIGTIIGVSHLLYRAYGSIDNIMAASFSDVVFRVLFSVLITYIFYTTHRLNRKDKELQEQKVKTLLQEKKLAESNYKILQSQMEPHFLFNTLANIRVLIDIEPDAAKKMTDNLTDLLRASMTKAQKQIICMKDELETVKAYLAIQKVRMGDRLEYNFSIDQELEDAECAPFTIQPLVENAILHGLEPSIKGGVLKVKISSDSSHIIVCIRNEGGIYQEDGWPILQAKGGNKNAKGNGIAMNNIRQRLHLLYGDEASLTLHKNDEQNGLSCDVTLMWPKQANVGDLV